MKEFGALLAVTLLTALVLAENKIVSGIQVFHY
jgi:hypothetical protein